MDISNPIQLFAFSGAGTISMALVLYQIYSRLLLNDRRKAFLSILVGALIVFFALLSAFHNKTGESIPWLFSSESIDRGVFEWGTATCLLIAVFFSLSLAKDVKNLQRFLFFGIAAACFLIAGEELSWGQWIFGWNTPEALAEVNLQNETNIHNLVNPRIYDVLYYVIGYTIIGLSVLSFFFFGKSKIEREAISIGILGLLRSGGKWLRESGNGLVITLSAATLIQHELAEEYAEFILALTVMLFVIHHYNAIRNAKIVDPNSSTLVNVEV